LQRQRTTTTAATPHAQTRLATLVARIVASFEEDFHLLTRRRDERENVHVGPTTQAVAEERARATLGRVGRCRQHQEDQQTRKGESQWREEALDRSRHRNPRITMPAG